METEILLSPCPACSLGALVQRDQDYQCDACGLRVKKKKKFLNLKSKPDQYIIQDIGDDFSIARAGVLDQTCSLDELADFRETLYTDQQLAEFATGNLDALNMPSSTLAQILLEQLRETCYLQINDIRRAHGPVLAIGGDRFPQDNIPVGELTWQDEGNLFLTNIRLVFPSDTFTFIRMDRKLIAAKAYEDGLAIQRKGEAFATYFTGCQAHQSALVVAYILGKVPHLRRAAVEVG